MKKERKKYKIHIDVIFSLFVTNDGRMNKCYRLRLIFVHVNKHLCRCQFLEYIYQTHV